MNKILKTSLLVLAGIVFFGVNYATTPVAQATSVGSFIAHPNPITSGQATIFTWNSIEGNPLALGTTSCVISGRGFPLGGLAVGRSGDTQSITPTTTQTTPETVTYSIICTTVIAGVTAELPGIKTTTLVIKPAGTAPVVNITATPNPVPAGTTQVTLNWGVTNASSCTASNSWSGTKAPNGTETVPLHGANVYRLTCLGGPSGRETGTASVTVNSAFVEPVYEEDKNISLLNCRLIPSTAGGVDFKGCVPIIVYLGIYKPASWLLGGAGLVFDTAIALSIDKDFITKPFVNDLWVIVRNFSNMIFIFVLIYTGVQTMLNMGGWQRAVRNVVIIALLINFSLFATKVVIDAGNILAVGIYSSMGADSPTQLISGNMKARGISQALVAGFNPAKFLGASARPMSDPFLALVVFIIATVVNAYVAYVLIKAALLFLGRLLAFWYLMIISPFAFTSITMPKGNIFDDWTKTLFAQAFVAPVFLFFIYIIMQVVSSGVLSEMFNSTSTTFGGVAIDMVIIPAILAMAIILALKKVLKFTESMAGDFGSAASNFVGSAVGTVGGLALGAATGGAAFALRQTVGRMAASAMRDGSIQEIADSQGGGVRGAIGRFAARRAVSGATTLQNATFDARNVSGAVGAAGSIGLTHLGTGSQTGMAQNQRAAAGERKAAEDRNKARERKAERRAELPTLEASLARMKSDYRILQGDNMDTVDPSTQVTITEGGQLQTIFNSADAAFGRLEVALQGNPSDPALQAAFVRVLAAKKAAEKKLKKYKEGRENMEKLEKKIEEYKAL